MTDEKLYWVMDDEKNRSFDDIPRLSPEEEAEIDRKCAELHHQIFQERERAIA